MLGVDPKKIADAFAAAGQPVADEVIAKVLASLQADEQVGLAQGGIILNALADKFIALKDTCKIVLTPKDGRFEISIEAKP